MSLCPATAIASTGDGTVLNYLCALEDGHPGHHQTAMGYLFQEIGGQFLSPFADVANQVHAMYLEFINAGFTEDRAFALTTTWVESLTKGATS